MNAGWKILLLSAVVFSATFGAERLLVPDIAPVALAEAPQALWSVEFAFVLRAVELMAAGAATIAIVLMLGALASRWLRWSARQGAGRISPRPRRPAD